MVKKMIKKDKENMKRAYTFIKGILVVSAMLLVFSGEAKLKGLPAMKSYKDYNLKKPDVASLKYTVYAPVVEGDKVTKGDLADFTAEIFFDSKGYRVKEIVTNMDGEVDVIINWQYNEAAGTVIEARTNKDGELLARTEYLVNYKLNTVLARRYQDIEDHGAKTVYPNVMVHEELWTENAKEKTVTFKKTYYDFRDGVAAKQSISTESMEKPYTLYLVLESLTAPIDYTWLYNYNDNALKASSGKTRKEPIYDGTLYEYKAKGKLLSNILHYDKDKILKNEITFVYSFDSKKNWTEVIQKESNKPAFIVQRDIKYRA
jgi:hypothetical protein